MWRDLGHAHPVGFGEDSEPVLIDATHRGFEPMPELLGEHELEGARKALRWVLVPVGRDGMVTKLLALRFALRLEPDSMACVAKKYGVSRAAISKHCTSFCDSLGMPSLRSDAAREAYSDAQRQVWKSGRRKK